jgi:cobaltochelatase CobT
VIPAHTMVSDTSRLAPSVSDTHLQVSGTDQFASVGGAVVRALVNDASLQWSGQTLYQGTDIVAFNAAHQHDVAQRLLDQRALLDGAALRLKLSDTRLHGQHRPENDIERFVYELLEQLRVESLAPDELPGLKHNLRERFIRWADEFQNSGLTETSLGILLFTIAVTSWSRLTGEEPPDQMSDLMEGTRVNIVPEIGPMLRGMKEFLRDQPNFITHALALARWVANAIETAESQAGNATRNRPQRNGFSLRLHFESSQTPEPPIATSGQSKAWQASAQRYRVFTKTYDQEANATDLVREAQLREFRVQMDTELTELGINVPRIARILLNRLARPHRDGWEFEQEEGYLDGRRLARLIADPQARHVFQQEFIRPVSNAAVTFLLDCSGSMKTHSQHTSLMMDVLCRAMDMVGIQNEVLGFSTQTWNGGRAKRDWIRAGKPALPGRLNEQLHIIFKPANREWRRARTGLAGLRRLDLFREGIDGEALLWAAQRLGQTPANRRLLVVISDGCPMDSATHQENDEHYLDEHLKQAIREIEFAGAIEVSAIGVGLDLGCFYRHRLALDLHEGMSESVLIETVNMMTSPRHA